MLWESCILCLNISVQLNISVKINAQKLRFLRSEELRRYESVALFGVWSQRRTKCQSNFQFSARNLLRQASRLVEIHPQSSSRYISSRHMIAHHMGRITVATGKAFQLYNTKIQANAYSTCIGNHAKIETQQIHPRPISKYQFPVRYLVGSSAPCHGASDCFLVIDIRNQTSYLE